MGIKKKVIKILSTLTEEKINIDSNLEHNLYLDTLDLCDLEAELNKEFNIKIKNIFKPDTVKDLVKIVKKEIKNK